MGYKTYTCPIKRNCGGCEWLAVPYPIQLRRKQTWIEGLFAMAAAADDTTIDPIAGMTGEPTKYRMKAATPFAPGPHDSIRSGFYIRGTHRIVTCKHCLAEDPRARHVLNEVVRIASRLRISAYQEDSERGILRHAIVRFGWHTAEALLVVVTNGKVIPRADEFIAELKHRCPEITSCVQNINTRRTNAMLGHESRVLFGPGVLHDELLGCRFEIGPGSFYQTNPAQTEKLYQLATDAAALTDGARVLDAYCGIGTIGICMAAHARKEGSSIQLTGVEEISEAVGCARRNARENKLDALCHFICTDASKFLKNTSTHFDTIVLDPPRAGATPSFLDSIVRLAPARVVYISCCAQTLARDVAILREARYRLCRLSPVDMFPHTKHVETVCLMSRAKG